MKKTNDSAKKRVPDPSQRTLTGKAVHFSWILICIVAFLLATILLAGTVSAAILYKKTKNYLEKDIIPNANYSLEGQTLNQSSFIYAKNKETGEYEELRQLAAVENRVWADYNEIPKTLIDACVAIEDKRFWEHDGVDWKRTLGASANMFLGGDTFGGSTITQQLIKNLTQKDEVTVRRKLTEIFTALDFEKHHEKWEILEWYLNVIYLGEGAYGVKSAASVYFGKELNELTLKECACLVGITNNPYMYDPYLHPVANEKRTQTILAEMLAQGKISQREYNIASAQELVLRNSSAQTSMTCTNCRYTDDEDLFEVEVSETEDRYICPACGTDLGEVKHNYNYYTYFEDQVIMDVTRDLMEQYGYTEAVASQMVTTGGFIIYSTIDLDAQAAVDSVYGNLDNIPGTYSDQQLQSGIVVIDNATGDIVALCGGVGEKTGSLVLDRATMSRRPTGSSIKPITVYGPALDLGLITPATAFEDSPAMQINGRDWPQNDSRTYSGWLVVNTGLTKSLNTISVKVLQRLTPQASYDFAKNKLGMYNLLEYDENNGNPLSDIDYAPLALGQLTYGVTVREMANAFATFPNKGVFREARTYTKVVDMNGKVILDNTQETHQAMSEHAAWYLTYMLQNAVRSGTGTAAYMKNTAAAGKTGTSSSNKDRWFSGYTPNYTASVWCGYDTPEEIRLKNGGNPACTLWKDVMLILHEDIEYKDFEEPTDEALVWTTVCAQTGLLPGDECTETAKVRLFKSDVPKEKCDYHDVIEVEVCHPTGDKDTTYVATDYCREFSELTHSFEFIALLGSGKLEISAATTPNLIEMMKLTIVLMENDEGKRPSLEEQQEAAIEEAELKECPVHTAAALDELRRQIEEARNKPDPTEPPGPEPTEPAPSESEGSWDPFLPDFAADLFELIFGD